LQNSVNSGKAAALWRGMQHAIALGVDQVITMDGDGQHRPDDIPALLAKAESSPEHLIIAARLRDTHLAPPARLAANRFADFWISWAAGQWIRDTQSGYRLYPVSLLKGIQPNITKQRGFVFESEIIIDALRGHYPCTYVPIASSYSADARASHFRPVADITQIVLMVGWRLLSRGFYPQGLWRVLKQMRSAGRDAGAS
jgi:GT2 family glycosyltransferase